MAIFGIEVQPGKIPEKYFSETNTRLQESNYIRNPFVGGVEEEEPGLYIMKVTPIYFNTSWIGIIVLIAFIFFGITKWYLLLIPTLMAGSGLFWSKAFFSWIATKGLKKAGYKDEIKIYNASQLIEYIYFK